MRALTTLLALLVAQAAAAQIGVPAVRLPPIGVPNLPSAQPPLDATLARAASLEDLRRLRVRELLRHRDLLEADPHGAPIVRGEILALVAEYAPAPAPAGLRVLRELPLAGLGLRLVVLQASGDTARTLRSVQGADPAGAYDFNHVYTASGMLAAAGEPGGAAAPPVAAVAATLGLIDGGVDARHEALAGVPLHQHGCAGRPVPDAHGTAVASLLVGRAAALHGAAPGGTLYAADVFCGLTSGGAVDAVVEAFAWLVRERVPVINVSLVGPPNRLLGAVIAAVLARGHIVVAAVGNDGPAAAPLYPAAWPGVVGVTAVDGHERLLPEAERGPQVQFAAPGADLAAAGLGHGYLLVRGTSFAAPLVAGLLAARLAVPDPSGAEAAVASLRHSARVLRQPVPNPQSGYGLVGAELRRQPALAALRMD